MTCVCIAALNLAHLQACQLEAGAIVALCFLVGIPQILPALQTVLRENCVLCLAACDLDDYACHISAMQLCLAALRNTVPQHGCCSVQAVSLASAC